MKAIVRDVYGPPEVLEIRELPEPKGDLAPDEVLIEVHATSVTTAEWRMRAAVFPPGFSLPGRLALGWSRPREPLTGRDFGGRVLAVGSAVTRLSPGDAVFGASPKGANVERLVLPESAAIVAAPAGLSHVEVAALPFGANTAMHFLADGAKVQPGERVLVLGASGGVGVYVVQLAKHLGAEVTGVASAANLDFVRELGADHVVDYAITDPLATGQIYDVIVDVAGISSFARAKPALAAAGRYVPIEGSLGDLWRGVWTRIWPGPRVISGVAMDTREALERVRALVEAGAIRPIVGRRFEMAEIVAAHRVVERRRGRRGAVIVELPAAESAKRASVVPLERVG
ncbi:NAD(P)-dependent alcohol dehydrogenase [Pseudenhygromyxa sp. WMMC2535]|uniref:NAD(P)-dependent alcohol dehydrogenase n=1 Tax=Pseudenhygromyxa sp. WMMC2535 TaxID=2712867 RepID=UPI001556EC4F|nr:NAD(P)-dependent alcohol dehydrogenase [Pseudenhygromyxa sp. WMMC2535]NVB38835.1 NAD(P)-dependent alcohol dehydrogenase [Pseudenhygromyxa sp. WMMC2535]